MQLLGLLMPLVGLIGFAAFIWLLVVAFRHSALWGVLVLLLSPITAIIFAVKNWDEAKKPFLCYIGSAAATVAILMITVVSVGTGMMQAAAEMGEQMEQQMADMQAAAVDEAESGGGVGAMASAPQETASAAVPADTATTAAAGSEIQEDVESPQAPEMADDDEPDEPVVSLRDPLSVANLEEYAGEPLRVTTSDGSDFVGYFVRREGDDLEFEKRLRSGTFAVFITADQIRSLEKVARR